MGSQIMLVPGVYVGETGKRRTLITVLGHTYVYTFDDVERRATAGSDDGIPTVKATTCTPRSFAAAVGSSPVRHFSEAEAAHLRAGVVSYRSRRLCNKMERTLFFPKDDVSEQVGEEKTLAEDPLKPANPSTVAKPSDGAETKPTNEPWYRRFQKWWSGSRRWPSR